MKPLKQQKSRPSALWQAWAKPVSVGLLTVCVASVVWGQEPTRINNANFNTSIDTTGNYQLTENIYLNETGRSPWTPFPSFNGILDGKGLAIYGLNIIENTDNENSGLFRRQDGEVKNLVFIDPQIVANGNGVYLGLVAGENNGNVTGIVWQGGRMEHKGSRTGNSPSYRYPSSGVVGQNLFGGRVKALALDVTQTASGDYSSAGIGAGDNFGTAQGVAQDVNQTASGDSFRAGIGAGENYGTAQGVAQNVTQTASGDYSYAGIGAGFNEGTAQGVAQNVTQTALRDNSYAGIGAGDNRGTAQGVAQDVTQTASGDHSRAGIGAGFNYGTAQGVAQDVTQTALGNYSRAGIGAGFNYGTAQGVAQGVALDVTQTASGYRSRAGIGAGFNDDGGMARGKKVTGEQLKAYNLTQLGLSRQNDWTAGDLTQFPMLVDLDGYQDMQRLSPEFKQAMRDYAPPSNNSEASWFSPAIWRALGGAIEHLLYDGERYHGFVSAHDGLAYWVVYEKDGSRVSLEPCCDVYSFSGLNDGGVVVDAVVNEDDTFYIAYHEPGRSDSRLARYETSGSVPQLEMSMEPLSARALDLLAHDRYLYVVSERNVQANTDATDAMPAFSAMAGETIRSARIVGDTLYVLLDSNEGSSEGSNEVFQVKAVNLKTRELDTAFSVIPVSVAEDQVVALQVGNQKIHLLVQENNLIRWLKYNLQGGKVSESLATLPDSVAVSHLDLVLEPIPGTQSFQEHVIAMGANSKNQPWWSVIASSTKSSNLFSGAWAGIAAAEATAVTVMATVMVGQALLLTH